MSILSLRECASMEPCIVGKKAYWNGRMILEKENVPGGICIPSDYFFQYISSFSQYDEIMNMMGQIKENRIYGRRNLSKIRQILSSGVISDSLVSEIVQALSEQGIELQRGVAVRSSSVNEDSNNMVFAGVYASYIDIETEDDLKKAIVGVWVSQFSEVALYYEKDCFRDGMAVIIQQMQYGDMYGVMFTKSPACSSAMLIEASKRTCDIVDGHPPDRSVTVSREQRNVDLDELGEDAEIFQAVSETGFRLEEKFNMFCDIEWTYSNGQVYLLQCRPLANTVNADFDYMVFSQDDTETCSNIYLGTCQTMYQRYLGKQQIFRQSVLQAGYNIYRQYYAIIRHNCISDSFIREIENCLNGAKFLIVEFSKELPAILCKISELKEKLTEYDQMNKVAYIYCRVGEIIDADLSGYSSLMRDGGVFVEYVPGRLTSLIHGFNLPAQLVIRNNQVEYSDIPCADIIETIDKQTGKKIRLDYGRQYPELTKQQISNLSDFTEKLAAAFPDIRLEWYVSGDKLYGKDLSIENDVLAYQEGVNFLSAGQCRGTVFRIDNEQLSILDNLAQKYDVSLYHHSKKEMQLYEDKQLEELVHQITVCEDAILLAERPSIGILGLAGCAKGMIFKKGAVLSHVGIFLREHHIPAVIDKNSYENLENGTKIAILSDGAVVIDRRDISALPADVRDEIDTFISQYNDSGKLLAVGLQGGYGRGSACASSDIDLVFLFRTEEDAVEYPKGFLQGKKHEIEVRYLSLDKLQINKWEAKIRYIYANEVLAYYDPQWELCRIITASRLTYSEQINEIVFGIRKAETLGIVVYDSALSCLEGFHCSNDPDYWIKRGDILSAHMWLNVVSERIARIIFAINGLYMPSNKWRYHIMMSLPWMPENLQIEWKRANCFSDFDVESFEVRKQAYRSMLTACVLEADKRTLLPVNFFEYYNKHIKRYTDNPD